MTSSQRNLPRLIAAQQALSAAIARIERAPTPAEPPAGMRWLIPPRHTLTANHEGDARPVEVALARSLFWRALLTHREPTRESLARAHGRLRGLAFQRLAAIRRAKAEPPPLKPNAPSPPAERLLPAAVTRAAGDGAEMAPDALSAETAPDAVTSDAEWALFDYYDLWGDATDIPADELVDATKLPLSDEEKAAIAEGITLENILTALQQENPQLSDLQIAQALDAAWNGQMTLWAGQTTFDAAGIGATFDIRDPWFLDYLRNQSGFWITNIDETTRSLVSQTLWDMLGGNPDLWAPAGSRGPDTVARWLQKWSNVYESDLAGMSYARAYMIAVTETARAETFGTFVSLWQTGARQKVWISTAGACVYCVTNTEEGPIPLTQAFPGGFQAPPQHVMCRCALGSFVSDDFSPDDWTPRPAGALTSLLSSWDGASWPATDLSALNDVELPGIDLAAAPQVTRARQRTAAAQPPRHPLSRDAFTALGEALAPSLESIGRAWLERLHIALPRDIEGVQALAKRVQALPPDVVRSADSAYLRRARQAIERAVRSL